MKSWTGRDIRHDATAVANSSANGTRRRRGVRQLVALLVAGDPAQAELHGRKLQLDGYAVVTATGLEPGLELAARARPDLVFMCLGAWAVPAIVLVVLRSDAATRGVPTVLISDLSRAALAAEVGGLLPTENVVLRRSAVHVSGERAMSERPAGCGHRPGWEQWGQASPRPPQA